MGDDGPILPSETVSERGSPSGAERRVPRRLLYVTLEAERPRSGAFRVALTRAASLTIGRGPKREVVRRTLDGEPSLHLTIPDPRLSSDHARILLGPSSAILEDRGSKNGSLLDGRRLERPGLLQDGSTLELGRTVFVYRAAIPMRPSDPLVLSSAELDGEGGLRTLIPPLASDFEALRRVSTSTVSVLVRGATGTGKERVARAVHDASGRPGAWVAVNCGALTDALLASELFGHKKGAFSGATRDSDGLVLSSSRGTLFLDEIGELSAKGQVALLRVLQEREVRPVGAAQAKPVDLRVVCATHQDLDARVEAGEFREDLLARLRGFELELPALAERREELGALVAELLKRPQREDVRGFDIEAARALITHRWPRNVRELDQAIAAATALSDDGRIAFSQLPRAVQEASARPVERTERSPADEERRARLLELFEEHRGNVTRVAEALGKKRQQIQKWVRRYGIDPAAFRE